MFLVVRYRPVRKTPLAVPERTWVRVLGTLNEYQARLFVAEKALQLGRGGVSHLSQLTGMSRVTITGGIRELRAGRKLRAATSDACASRVAGGRRWSTPIPSYPIGSERSWKKQPRVIR